MKEEFHALRNADNVVTASKQLYGWNSLTANIWLPSYSELAGCNMDTYLEQFGTSKGMMTDISEANVWQHVNPAGGGQFTRLAQLNETGGGTYIWQLCAQQWSWLRSPSYRGANTAWSILDSARVTDRTVTESHAVHPAVITVKQYRQALQKESGGEFPR